MWVIIYRKSVIFFTVSFQRSAFLYLAELSRLFAGKKAKKLFKLFKTGLLAFIPRTVAQKFEVLFGNF